MHSAALLLGHTDSPSSPSRGLGMLAADTEAPVVSKTTVGPDLLQTLQVVTELGVDTVRKDLGIFAVDDILLAIEEPGRDLVLRGVLEDGDDSLEFFGREFTGTEDTHSLAI